jgi:hypothetical protein
MENQSYIPQDRQIKALITTNIIVIALLVIVLFLVVFLFGYVASEIKAERASQSVQELPQVSVPTVTAPLTNNQRVQPRQNSAPMEHAIATPGEQSAATSEHSQIPALVLSEVKESEVVIPLQKSQQESLSILKTELMKLPHISTGGPNNPIEIIVMYDPFCEKCHELFKTTMAKKGVTIHWVATNIFPNADQSRLVSAYINDLILSGKQADAFAYLESLISLRPKAIPNDWVPSEAAKIALRRSTIAINQIGTGTPAVIYRDKSTQKFSILDGVPLETDWAVLGKI